MLADKEHMQNDSDNGHKEIVTMRKPTLATLVLLSVFSLPALAADVQVTGYGQASGGGLGEAFLVAHNDAIAKCSALGGTEVAGSFQVIQYSTNPPEWAVIEITCRVP